MAHTKLHTVISGTVYILIRPGQLFRALSPSSASHWLCVDFNRHWTPTRNHSLLALIIKSKIAKRSHPVTRTVRLDHWLGQFKPELGPNLLEEKNSRYPAIEKLFKRKNVFWWNNARYWTKKLMLTKQVFLQLKPSTHSRVSTPEMIR